MHEMKGGERHRYRQGLLDGSESEDDLRESEIKKTDTKSMDVPGAAHPTEF